MASGAIFIERDNVLIADAGYMAGHDAVKLLPGVELAIKSLRQAGYSIVVVTNQPGVARGLLTEDALESTHSALRQILAEKAARLDGIYYCPNHPGGSVDRYAEESPSRMPQPGLLEKAAADMQIDLASSWIVGATSAAIGAGHHAGCRTIRVKGPPAQIARDGEPAEEEFRPDHSVRNLVDAARVIMRETAAARETSSDEVPAGNADIAPLRPKTPGTAPARQQPKGRPAESADTVEPSETTAETTSEPPANAASETPNPVEQVANALRDTTDDESPPHGDPLEAASGTGPPAPRDDADSEVRKEILRHVRQIVRQKDTQEFSLTNVVGGIAQMFAGLCLLLAIIKAVGYNDTPQGTFWVLVAILFQATSLTFFVMGRHQDG
jgi:D,D-heptose 1,7-bisphosphate phosphatase